MAAFEGEGLGHHPDGEDAALTGALGDDGRGAGAGAAAHARGDEHHVGAVEMFTDLRTGFFGGGHADLGMRACAETLGHRDPELDAPLGLGKGQLLSVGIGDDELDTFEPRFNHIVDCVAPGAADAEDDDARLQFGGARSRKMNGHGNPCVVRHAATKTGDPPAGA